MREYALIDPEARRVEVFRPTDDGHWKLYNMSDEPTLILSSLSYELAQREVFKGWTDRLTIRPNAHPATVSIAAPWVRARPR